MRNQSYSELGGTSAYADYFLVVPKPKVKRKFSGVETLTH